MMPMRYQHASRDRDAYLANVTSKYVSRVHTTVALVPRTGRGGQR